MRFLCNDLKGQMVFEYKLHHLLARIQYVKERTKNEIYCDIKVLQVFSIEIYHSWDNPFTLFIPLASMFDKIREQIGFNFSKISWRAVAVH